MNNFFKVIGLALAVHIIVKTVQKELKAMGLRIKPQKYPLDPLGTFLEIIPFQAHHNMITG